MPQIHDAERAATADFAIRLDDLGYEVADRPVLSGVTLHSSARRIGVVGRNGSGKSTLARLLAGLLAPTGGRIRINGRDLYRDRRAALDTVGILFQNPEHQIIFPRVSEEIAFGLRQQGLGKAQAAVRVQAVLRAFDKPHWHDAPISALSQGQKHLVCMMAVLAMRPKLLILDEPYAGLDIPTRRQLARHLHRADTRLLHISHEPADLEACDELFWLDRGRIVARGGPSELLPAFTAEMIRLGDLDDLADLAG
ncbi:energy-coupling factor ABC transporter ATP-binding protein [Paracoccus aminovorans]|uniref:energy-coupling factor ABC transporter ATP-binding protein n=1 Tax=Paracoccus aminovorans TaxID=34004 RepID=UPI002B263DBE|nr:ABC transporter ATP-binding protein [Paracoccus aminovorans]